MAKLVYGLNQSLDGYVNHDAFGPGPTLFRHFIDHMGAVTASVYGGRMYEIMRYWDEDQPGWDAPEREYAQAWRATPKYVVSRTLKEVGPNATLVEGDLATAMRGLKERLEGEIEIAGPGLANQLMAPDMIDEYRIYLHPVVVGPKLGAEGVLFFSEAPPPLELVSSELVGDDVVLLTYAPA
ncbi:dihydrofolate reductase family protein [Brevundimonas goettingensis]|jgi:dihydrofolate reductase|uniref:Dihydrofolate reductase family protein n=1 Tax=Brevundimonas goettingensis TaxID=2774190 RepID=A0A975C3L1_9CAUL|nr:dihydrofolate reductase family protein [Brevundimonas goettingensis]QTC91245.1 dihydrofolate reductase family protein [Brevundimonas goettingensis]